ncbi:MAG: MBL fold metallo-hydrolase [Bacteroidota bacterium]
MKRRKFIQKNTGFLASLPLIPVNPLILFNGMEEAIFKYTIGRFECTLFKDLMFTYQAKDYFINANQKELDDALNRYNLSPESIPSPYIAMLLQDGNRNILIDSGIGFSENPIVFKGKTFVLKGRLRQLLAKENIHPGDITDVIITHFHPDHIGGLYTGEGSLVFSNAQFHMRQNEWDFWHSPKADSQPPLFHYFIKKNITPLKNGSLNLITKDNVQLYEGITALETPGHTPGQLALVIEGKLLYISDAFLHPLHMEHLDWRTSYDLDHEKSRKTRVKLLELAHTEGMRIHAFHFDFPGLGFAEKYKQGWKWVFDG